MRCTEVEVRVGNVVFKGEMRFRVLYCFVVCDDVQGETRKSFFWRKREQENERVRK